MNVSIRKMGNSAGVIIPKALLAMLEVKTGDNLDLSFDDGQLILARVKAHPRAGWAEESKALAEAGDGGLVWPEFGNLGDDDLEW
jgi:antitoxin MazE